MPIYEYECENKHRFEKWQSIKDDPITECPECGTTVRKIFHPAGIIFKGSGWYITDSRKPSGGEAKAEAKADKSEPKAGEAVKTDSKSEAKTESKTGSKGESSGGESQVKPSSTNGS
jgi:putative FmdB family regulatory protein